MSAQSKIEWTDATWNPVRGCTQISPGCKNCYAKTFAERWRGIPGHPFEYGFDVRLIPEKLAEPIRWATSKMIFVNSMSDLFHPSVTDEYLRKVGQVMRTADWHIYQVLTKRPERMRSALLSVLKEEAAEEQIWWGVSVEDRKHGLPRVKVLRECPAFVRFLSVEPILEDLGDFDLDGIDWVIAGGESGPRSRPVMREWVVRLRDQCKEAGVPFFFKQWGGIRKHLTGHELDGKVYQAFPPHRKNPVPALKSRMELLATV